MRSLLNNPCLRSKLQTDIAGPQRTDGTVKPSTACQLALTHRICRRKTMLFYNLFPVNFNGSRTSGLCISCGTTGINSDINCPKTALVKETKKVGKTLPFVSDDISHSERNGLGWKHRQFLVEANQLPALIERLVGDLRNTAKVVMEIPAAVNGKVHDVTH